MNDPIEDALSRMKPAEMPPALMARLTAARAQVAGKPEAKAAGGRRAGWLLRWLAPVGVCAAVAVATVAFLESNHAGGSGGTQPLIADNTGPGTKVPAGGNALPFESEDRLVNAREVGFVVAPNRRPFRLMQVDWVQSDTLQPPGGGAAVRVETTRRQVVPVAVEIY
jgi:hypothetical protein